MIRSGVRSAPRPDVDPRCEHRAPDGTGRCQLWAGHEGPHAAMFGRDGRRVVRAWTDGCDGTVRDVNSGFEKLPWMLGYPAPAWRECS